MYLVFQSVSSKEHNTPREVSSRGGRSQSVNFLCWFMVGPQSTGLAWLVDFLDFVYMVSFNSAEIHMCREIRTSGV